eukprot:TRINITY_DN1971_c0_g1_i9.p2 TRINITY_DN1971_c0_g1~~TRINITY_DN1971_c0_g1_i9.p2  ORF type:complete len:122 (+),score=20.90 TRINITY_DN1971_c0_g1_i9:3-368(+)
MSGQDVYNAAERGEDAEVLRLLERGVEVNWADPEGRTALWSAAFEGQTATVEVLLSRGAAIDQAKKNGATPLYVAAYNGHTPTVELLLSKCCNQPSNERWCHTALCCSTNAMDTLQQWSCC